jgi:hypothetical protein
LDYCQIIDYALKRLILGSSLLKKSVVLLFGICHITNIRLYKKNNAVSFTISILKLAVVVRLIADSKWWCHHGHSVCSSLKQALQPLAYA